MSISKLHFLLLVFIYTFSAINSKSQDLNSKNDSNIYIESSSLALNDDERDIEDLESVDYYDEPCPDSLVYGNLKAKNYAIIRNKDKVRKLYFDEISLSIVNDDVSFIHTPTFRDEEGTIGNRLSFRIEEGLKYNGENYLRHFGIVAHNIDCFEIPDKIGSIFSENSVKLSNYREDGDSKFVDAEITMRAEKHEQSLIAYFYDIIIVEKKNERTKLDAKLHYNDKSLKVKTGKLHYHSNPSPSPMSESGLVIELDSDTLNLFRFKNFEVSTGDYINYQYLYRITEINDENISLQVYSFPANEAKLAVENSFFPDAKENIMQKYTAADKLTLILEIENAPYTQDVTLKGYTYNKYRALENNLHDVAYFDETLKSDVEELPAPTKLKLNTDYNNRVANQMGRSEYKEWTEANADGYVLTYWYGDLKEEVDESEQSPKVDCKSIFRNFEKKASELSINLRDQGMSPFENEKVYNIFFEEVKAANGGHDMFRGFSTFEQDMQLWQSKYCDGARQRKPREPNIKKIQLDKSGNPLRKDYSDEFKRGTLIANFDKDKIILEASSEAQGNETFELEVPEGTIDVMQIGMAVASIEAKVGTENFINVFHTSYSTSHSARSSSKWEAGSDNNEPIQVKTITRGHIYPKVSRAILSVRNLNERELSLSDEITDDLIAVDIKINTNINGLILKSSYHFSQRGSNEFRTVKTYFINRENHIVAFTSPEYDFLFVN